MWNADRQEAQLPKKRSWEVRKMGIGDGRKKRSWEVRKMGIGDGKKKRFETF